MKWIGKQCQQCRVALTGVRRYCDECGDANWFRAHFISGRRFCAAEVGRARRRNHLAPPWTLDCADCGGQATEYDHRDYSRALDVQPVCRGCNARRGSAVPRKWQRDELIAYAVKSLRNSRLVWAGYTDAKWVRYAERFAAACADFGIGFDDLCAASSTLAEAVAAVRAGAKAQSEALAR